MQTICPNCRHEVIANSAPVRGLSNDGTEIWLCLKCPVIVCGNPIDLGNGNSVPCYASHLEKAHPEVYGLKPGPTKGGKKNKKK